MSTTLHPAAAQPAPQRDAYAAPAREADAVTGIASNGPAAASALPRGINPPAGARVAGRRKSRGDVKTSWITLAGLAVLIAAWWLSVRLLHVPSYILPEPLAVVRAL
ncbi:MULTISPECIES: hypothetical protein [unclassified Achromobacter]|uniref:hypothetical protein n=1 Tax=unclassified Achromobacter TaxID=2626865 RepID=UPI0018E9708D|nr:MULTISPECIES: hypothetical protein [unclassified Achromobacter]